VLVHPGEVILPELGEKLGRYAQEKLKMRGVEIRGNTKVASVTGRGVKLSDGECIDTFNIVWTAGTSPNPHLAGLPCLKERGLVCVNEFLEVADWPGVWSLGDCATVPISPRVNVSAHGPTRITSGTGARAKHLATIRGEKKKPFRFKTARRDGEYRAPRGCGGGVGFQFSGFIAWWMWRTIYSANCRASKEVPCGAGLDAGLAVPQRPGPIPNPADRRRLLQGSGAGESRKPAE